MKRLYIPLHMETLIMMLQKILTLTTTYYITLYSMPK